MVAVMAAHDPPTYPGLGGSTSAVIGVVTGLMPGYMCIMVVSGAIVRVTQS
jgi:hypothetical protein